MKAARPLSEMWVGAGLKMKSEEQSHAQRYYPFLRSPRCGAKTRKGTPCKAPAMANGRCRMHGGKAGAPRGNQNALKHGHYTAEAIAQKRYIRNLLKRSKELIEEV